MELSELLQISAQSSSQPCNKYGIHYKLPELKKLYDNGDASFIANIGVLTSHVTKENYLRKTATQLFAHDKSELQSSSSLSLSQPDILFKNF